MGEHFRSHMDGVVLGLLQAPKTWHVLEIKATAEKKLAALRKAVAGRTRAGLASTLISKRRRPAARTTSTSRAWSRASR